MAHKQVFAQVKTLVDSGIKDVVEALNRIPNVWTTDSCEGDKGECAEIRLHYGNLVSSYRSSADFAQRLYLVLIDRRCRVDIALEWSCPNTLSPFIILSFHKSEVKGICDALSDV
ncbi:hypothetical protein ES705_10567 [subsurface metagenome]|jgi:hypothetical protein